MNQIIQKLKLTVGLIKIPVKNVELSSAFYQKYLGFTVEFLADKFGWATLSKDDITLGLYEPGKGGGNRTIGGSVDFNFHLSSIENLKDIYEELKEKGVKFVNQYEISPDGSHFFEIIDPDGNIIKLGAEN